MNTANPSQADASTLSFSAIEALRRRAGEIRAVAGKAMGDAYRAGDQEAALPTMLRCMEQMKPIAHRFTDWRMIDARNARHAWNEIDDAYGHIRDAVGGRRHEIAKAKRKAIRSELDVILPASAKHLPNTVRSYPSPAKPTPAPVADIETTTRALSIDETLSHLLTVLSGVDAATPLPVYKVMVRERHLGVLRTVGDLRGLSAVDLTALPGLGRTAAFNLLAETARKAGVATALVRDPARIVPADRHDRVLHALHYGLEVRYGVRETYAGKMQRCVYAVDPQGGDRALAYNETDGVVAGMAASVRGKLDGLLEAATTDGVTTWSLTDEGRAEAVRRFGAING